MTKEQITLQNEAIGRNSFINYVDTYHPDWNICKWSNNIHSIYDVAYTTGTTNDFIIGEIKFRKGFKHNAFDNWILEQSKSDSLQELKKLMQIKHPDKKIFIHYINFYSDNLTKPRMWDITNIDPDYEQKLLPNNSNTVTAYERTTAATYLHNNDTINFLN